MKQFNIKVMSILYEKLSPQTESKMEFWLIYTQ